MIDKPKQLEVPVLKKLSAICQEYIDFIDSDDYHCDNDYKQYIFESALESIFGDKIWNYINNRLI